MRSMILKPLGFLLYFSLFCLASSPIDAQTTFTGVNGSNQGDINFSISHPNPGYVAFFDFNDGRFSRHTLPSFTYPYDNAGTYYAKATVADRYRPGTISKRVNSGSQSESVTTNGPSSQAPLAVVTTDNINISRAWDNAPSEENIYVVTVENRDFPGQQVSGTVTVNTPTELHIQADSFYINSALVNGTLNSREWSFTNLAYQEQRNFFVYVKTDPNAVVGAGGTVGATINYGPSGSMIYNDTDEYFTYATHPHDPNKLFANPECIKPEWPEGQTINYTVTFLNEGQAAAENVSISLPLPTNLVYSTLVKTGSSHNCTWSVSGNILEVEYPAINLPGLEQDQNEGVIPYDQCTGYFKFSICTDPLLADALVLQAHAEIIFDNEPPISTDPAYLWTDYGCPASYSCDGAMITRVDEVLEYDAIVYPNPVSELLYVKSNGELSRKDIFIEIYSSDGKLALRKGLVENSGVNVSKLQPGFYIYKVFTNGAEQTGHFIKI